MNSEQRQKSHNVITKEAARIIFNKVEASRLRQKLALAETMVNVWKSAAEYAARIADERYAALAELVALKAMKDEMSHMLLREEGGMGLDYDRRNPLAWERARELVGSNGGGNGPAACGRSR